MMQMAVLGCTGSIGTQTLSVAANHNDKVHIVAMSAGRNVDLLITQLQQLAAAQQPLPHWICLQDEPARQAFLAAAQAYKGTVLCGPDGLQTLATLPQVDTVMMGLVGFIGLAPSLAAVQAGKRLLTANKETFVTGGHLIQPWLSQIVPVDSEHSALFQCLQGHAPDSVKQLLLTASGGPFRQTPHEQFNQITPAQALKHPNWVMGSKVTIDSATLMNKGLEVIEAHWLFGVSSEKIQVVVHPQSMVHSGVAFIDGSVLLQAGQPSMHIPIQVAMAHPDRWGMADPTQHLDWSGASNWTFEAPDTRRFPCLGLAYDALAIGPHATTALNAANEWAVARFLADDLAFTAIPTVLADVLEHVNATWSVPNTVDDVLAISHWAIDRCQQCYPRLASAR
jgi:1-deoxy-D-xylulose-5-phosphate reductoisomerase